MQTLYHFVPCLLCGAVTGDGGGRRQEVLEACHLAVLCAAQAADALVRRCHEPNTRACVIPAPYKDTCNIHADIYIQILRTNDAYMYCLE
jgi:hypothetical protein